MSLAPMYKQNPTFLVSDWKQPVTEAELLGFKVKVKSRKGMMFHYYSDMIDCIRNERQKEMDSKNTQLW